MNSVRLPRGRIDSYPTHRVAGLSLRAGRPFPFGATLVPGGVNFSVFSKGASAMTLVLFRRGQAHPIAEVPFPDEFRTGSVYSMTVFDLDYEHVEYGFRASGPPSPEIGDRFDPSRILLDPYAKVVGGRDVWGRWPDRGDVYPYRARLLFDDFDWEGDRPPEIPSEDIVLYETHVRGFTRHPSSRVRAPGTFAAMREKIPYLRDLGINCLELMPVFEFDEFENSRADPGTGEQLLNYWGYSTVAFFAPKAGYAATGRLGMQADEFKTLVKDLHRAGIEVVLDVVFNHTAEGNEHGPTIAFRGLDNKTYYMLTATGEYYNFSGTGNTVNCNHPVVRDFILDCLRHWVTEYHVDGFRFDLAAILDRDPSGAPLANPPLVETLAHDPILGRCKLIAEAWDAGGLYQVGSFPAYGRWSEWNGRYRDAVRRYLKGDQGTAAELATRIVGSPDLYAGRGAVASVNFITAHDGFTLYDLVSYNEKHNEQNGEDNNDGANDNNSWNCGREGPTDDGRIRRLRYQQVKNAFAILLTSQGMPMLLSGDEVGRTQRGNNNAYCHDNDLTWFDWSLLDQHEELLGFVKSCIAFRRAHPVLRSAYHPVGPDHTGTDLPHVSWHGVEAWRPDWSPESRLVALMRSGEGSGRGVDGPDHVYLAVNAHWQANTVEVPRLPEGMAWHVFANTAMPPPEDAFTPGTEPLLRDPHHLLIGPRSTIILTGRPSTNGARP